MNASEARGAADGPTQTLVYKIVFDAALAAVVVGQPDISHLDAVAIASSTARRASAEIEAVTADFLSRLEIAAAREQRAS